MVDEPADSYSQVVECDQDFNEINNMFPREPRKLRTQELSLAPLFQPILVKHYNSPKLKHQNKDRIQKIFTLLALLFLKFPCSQTEEQSHGHKKHTFGNTKNPYQGFGCLTCLVNNQHLL